MSSTLLPSPRLLSQFKGGMVGALVGDCFGRMYEFDFYRKTWEPDEFISKFLSEEFHQLLPYTDDTAMSISIAQSLIEKKELDPVDLAKKFTDEYFRDPRRCYGGHVVYVFQSLKTSEFKDVFLPATRQFNGEGSFGNGAAMRISPMALFGSLKGESYLKNAVEQSSRLTHTHPDGYNGAILLAIAIKIALESNPQNKQSPIDFIFDFIEKLQIKMAEIENAQAKKPYCKKLEKIRKIYLKKIDNMSAEEIADYLGNGEPALESVPTAIYCFLKGLQPISKFESSNPFVRTIYFAMSIGGDADTIASMAGSISGAYYGMEGIPDNLHIPCEKIDEVIKLAEDLYNTAVETTTISKQDDALGHLAESGGTSRI